MLAGQPKPALRIWVKKGRRDDSPSSAQPAASLGRNKSPAGGAKQVVACSQNNRLPPTEQSRAVVTYQPRKSGTRQARNWQKIEQSVARGDQEEKGNRDGLAEALAYKTESLIESVRHVPSCVPHVSCVEDKDGEKGDYVCGDTKSDEYMSTTPWVIYGPVKFTEWFFIPLSLTVVCFFLPRLVCYYAIAAAMIGQFLMRILGWILLATYGGVANLDASGMAQFWRNRRNVSVENWMSPRLALIRLMSVVSGSSIIPVAIVRVAAIHRVEAPDVRAPYLRAAKLYEGPSYIQVVEVIESGSHTQLLVDTAMVDQLEVKGELMSDVDLKLLSTHSARLQYMNVPADLYPAIVSGSAHLAKLRVCHLRRPTASFIDGLMTVVPTQYSLKIASGIGLAVVGSLSGLTWYATGLSWSPAMLFSYMSHLRYWSFVTIFEEVSFFFFGTGFRICFTFMELVSRNCEYEALPAFAFHLLMLSQSCRTSFACHVVFNCLALVPQTNLVSFPEFMYVAYFEKFYPAGSLGTLVFSVFSFLFLKSAVPKVLLGYGYRMGEVLFPPRRPSLAKVRKHPNFEVEERRVPCQISLGPHLRGIAPPMPDPSHGPTALDGSLHRFACEMPEPDPELLGMFRGFVGRFVRQHYTPLLPGQLMSVEEWLETTTYSVDRKTELLRAWSDCCGTITTRDRVVSGFIKRETYPSFKYARGINSRKDAFKCAVGPAFKEIEKVVYDSGNFIKHIPVKDRPQYIMDRLGSYPGPWYETDYTSFEGSFQAVFMEVCEMVLYRHMLVNYPDLLAEIEGTLMGVNECRYKWFTIRVEARRMSGEMCTSLGNGFSNLMLAKFLAWRVGASIDIIVEGDDGLMYSNKPMDVSPLKRLGFEIKLLTHSDLLRSSFCGLKLSRDLCSMTCPRKVLLNFAWTHSPLMWGGTKIRLGLLRAKALSLLYEHPRCPIISALAWRFVTLTSGVASIFDNSWYGSQLKAESQMYHAWACSEFCKGVSSDTRTDFDQMFGIGVADQLRIEEDIESWNVAEVVSSRVDSLFGSEWNDARDYWDLFVSDSKNFF